MVANNRETERMGSVSDESGPMNVLLITENTLVEDYSLPTGKVWDSKEAEKEE